MHAAGPEWHTFGRSTLPIMRSALLFFLLLSFGTQLARGQSFEPGYLVLQRGDTLRGEVENVFWEDPPTVVRFRPAASARLVAYAARQLRSVYLGSGRLLRHELLPIDRYAETRLNSLTNGILRRQRPDSVLADVLVLGPATLLGITLSETKHFFVQRPGQPYMEMAGRNYLMQQDGTPHVADANDYKSQLLRYFGDCEAATSLLATTAFTTEGLRRVVKTFNQQCSGVPQPREETAVIADSQPTRSHVAIRLGVLAGGRFNSMHLNGNGQPGTVLNGYNIDGRLHPQAGLYADVVNGGRRLAFHTALLVSQFGRPHPVAFAGTATTWRGSYQWSSTNVALQLGLRGLLPIGPQLQLLVGAGYEANSFWNSTSVFVYDNQSGDFIDSFNSSALPYVEVGLSRNRLAAVLNGRVYEETHFSHWAALPAGLTTVDYTYTPWSLSLALSYRLNADSDAQAPPTR